MDTYYIRGGRRLVGSIPVHGAKNSALPILTAAVLARGKSVLHNCPDLTDVSHTLGILRCLGCTVSRQGETVTVDTSVLSDCKVPSCLMGKMRSSVLFLGALLAREGEAVLSLPGGCALGPRPINLHLEAMRALGAEIVEDDGKITCRAKKLTGSRIILAFPSVGATENIMLAAVAARGTTTILNAAREPEIADLQGFLRSMGAKIWGAGGPVIVIEGDYPLHPGEYSVMPDRIVTATCLAATAAAGGKTELTGTDWRTVSPVIEALREAGCRINSNGDRIQLESNGRLTGVQTVYTAPYPGFPTDAQPVLMAALAGGTGTTRFVETIFDSRFGHAPELCRMGASIHIEGHTAEVCGASGLHGAVVEARDLRGGAALVVAALGAQGETEIGGLAYIDRGYENLDERLRQLGADVVRRSGENCPEK